MPDARGMTTHQEAAVYLENQRRSAAARAAESTAAHLRSKQAQEESFKTQEEFARRDNEAHREAMAKAERNRIAQLKSEHGLTNHLLLHRR